MPTTIIETAPVDPAFARQVAKELSFWWRREGADLNHVITRFAELPGDRVFSGPFPLTSWPAADAGRPAAPPFAFVDCVVSRERDGAFRRRYARAVVDALAPRIPEDRVFVSFRPVDPSDHFAPGAVPRAEPTLERS